jgi:hypothetical protein
LNLQLNVGVAIDILRYVTMSNILIKKEKSVSVSELWVGDKQIRCVVLVDGLVAWVNAGEKSVLGAK